MRYLVPLSLAMVAQAGCSLMGLTDFTTYECSSHTECEPLNQRRGIASEACVRYQCAVDSRCRLQPLDADRDGHASTRCASSPECGGTIPCDDCDDTSAASYPGQTEVCDGVDNDCNLVIDDVPGSAQASSTTVVSGTDSPTWHAYGRPLRGSSVASVAFGRVAATYFNVVGRDTTAAQTIGSAAVHVTDLVASAAIMPGCPSDDVRVAAPSTPVGAGTGPTTCMTHDDCSDGITCNGFELCDPLAASADATGCVVDVPEPACRASALCNEERGTCELSSLGIATSCNVAELAAAELAPGVWFGAMKSPAGCGGLLRVGHFTEGMGDGRADPGRNVLFRGNFTRSTSFRGIDLVSVDAMGRCTGLARPEGEPLGLRSIAVAALPADPGQGRLRPQALVTWLVGQGVGPSAVEVIGLWHEEFSSTPWVNATGNAIQQRLDSIALGDVRPALLSWTGDETAGYIVAYGVQGGGIAIRFVPAFADDDEVSASGTTPIMPGATTPRATEPIADLGTEVLLPTSGAAGAVQLVMGPHDGCTAELALSWHDADGVRFSRVDFDAGAGTFAAFESKPVASGGADEIALGYAATGLVLPGFQRGGAVADEHSTGGYLIAWRAGGSVSGARFASLDGERVGPNVMRLGGDLRRLHLYLSTEQNDAGTDRVVPRLVYHDAAAQEFRVLDAFCGPGG